MWLRTDAEPRGPINYAYRVLPRDSCQDASRKETFVPARCALLGLSVAAVFPPHVHRLNENHRRGKDTRGGKQPHTSGRGKQRGAG